MSCLLISDGPDSCEDGAGQACAAYAYFHHLFAVRSDYQGNAGVGISQRRDVRCLASGTRKRLLPRGFGEVKALTATTAAYQTENLRWIKHSSDGDVGDGI